MKIRHVEVDYNKFLVEVDYNKFLVESKIEHGSRLFNCLAINTENEKHFFISSNKEKIAIYLPLECYKHSLTSLPLVVLQALCVLDTELVQVTGISHEHCIHIRCIEDLHKCNETENTTYYLKELALIQHAPIGFENVFPLHFPESFPPNCYLFPSVKISSTT